MQQPSELPKSMLWHGKEQGALFPEKWHECAHEKIRADNTARVIKVQGTGLYSSVT